MLGDQEGWSEPTTITLDSYRAHRERLLRESFPITAWIAFGVVVLYAIGDYFKNPLFFDDFPRIVIEMATPIAALLLVRGPLRNQVRIAVLGFDLVYTFFMATGMLAPANTISGTALFLSLKMLGTALLLRWSPAFQVGSTLFTLALYFAVLPLANKPPDPGLPALSIHQIIGPLIGGFLSILGAYFIDRTHRQLFQHGMRLARSESRLRAKLAAEKRLLAEVQEANRLQSEFVDNMSHELRTPLNVILGYTELLVPHVETDAEAKQFLDRIQSGARGLNRLLESVLEYAHLDRRHARVRPKQFRAEHILHELRNLCDEVHHQPGVTVELDPAPGVELFTDYERLYSALSQLLLNALKFTLAGAVRVRIQPAGGEVEFVVSDTGIGIAEEQLPHVFEPFRQADGSHTRPFGGVGLGLAIVRRNVELLGGQVSVRSKLGEGSTFTVRIPRTLAA